MHCTAIRLIGYHQSNGNYHGEGTAFLGSADDKLHSLRTRLAQHHATEYNAAWLEPNHGLAGLLTWRKDFR